MRQLFVWVLSAVLFAAMGGLGMWFFVTGETDHEEHGPPATESAPAEIPPVSRDETGAVVLHLDEATQKRVGLQITLLPAATDQPEVVAYGAVQEDPAQSFTLRAPLPGTLMASKDGGWPQIGQQVAAGATVGALAPRLGPVEQADLMAKLAAAQADEQEARASLDSLRLSLESKRKLNAEQKIVSDQVLQEAEAKAKGEEARLRGAQETVKVLQASAAGLALTQTVPLVVGKAGRVLEVMAQPGEAVEGGLALVRLASTDRLVAKVSLPAGITVARIGAASIEFAGHRERKVIAEEISPAPTVDAVTGGQTLLLGFAPGELRVQPGMSVKARLKVAGELLKGVSVPQDAIVRYVGAAWVYVQTGEEAFTRREVRLDRLTDKGWFVAAGPLSPGDPVVSRAAQSLLSQELKFQTGGGEEEEE